MQHFHHPSSLKIPGIAYMERTPAFKLNTPINKLKDDDDDELRGQVLLRKAVLKGNGKAFTGGDVKTLEAWADECGFLKVGVNQLMYSVSFVHVLLERSSVCMHAVQNACVVEEKYASLYRVPTHCMTFDSAESTPCCTSSGCSSSNSYAGAC